MATDSMADVAAQLAQLNAHIRSGAGGADFKRNVLAQVGQFSKRQGLSWRPAVIPLSKELAGAASGAADASMSADEFFVVQSVRGFVTMNNITAETLAIGNLTPAVSVADRLTLKAQNCSVILMNKETKMPIFEGDSGIPLSSITPEAGGLPLIFGPDDVAQFIIPANFKMQAQFALASAAAPYNTAVTYGVMLVGAYVNPNA